MTEPHTNTESILESAIEVTFVTEVNGVRLGLKKLISKDAVDLWVLPFDESEVLESYREFKRAMDQKV